jgi:hypothetical protein
LVQVTKCNQITSIMNSLSLRCLYQDHLMSKHGRYSKLENTGLVKREQQPRANHKQDSKMEKIQMKGD